MEEREDKRGMTYNFDKLSLVAICIAIQREDDLRLTIAENMMQYGGSFVQALGKCLLLADYQNRFILAEAFMEYMIEYQPNKWLEEEKTKEQS